MANRLKNESLLLGATLPSLTNYTLILALLDIYYEGLKMVWTAMWAVAGVGLFCSIFWIEEISLERTQ